MPCSFIDPISQKMTFTRNKTRQISSIVRPAIEPAPWLEAFVRSEPCFTHSGFNPSKTDSELRVGTGGFLVERKCQMTHHHHVAGYMFRASKKWPLYLPQSYHMVNFITGRSHSLLEKFNLQHSGWLETEEKEGQEIWGCSYLQTYLDAAIAGSSLWERNIWESVDIGESYCQTKKLLLVFCDTYCHPVMRRSWAGMGRDLLVARSVRGPADSSEPEVHGHLHKTGHCRPWEKMILPPCSALRAGGWSPSPDSDHRG